MSAIYDKLAADLLAAHSKNANGCLWTDYSSIRGLKVQASTTNGTSGIGVYRGHRVYWYMDYGYDYNPDTQRLTKISEPKFKVESA